MVFYPLTVARLEKESGNATSVYFHVPDELQGAFRGLPGQHLTLRVALESDGSNKDSPDKNILERRYSISSAPGMPLRITVKAQSKGKVSGFINNALKPGDEVEVATPSGNFVLDAKPTFRRSHYFFAAGSGITPIYSMLTAVLEAEPDSFAYLLYGNKDHKQSIFADALQKLQDKYPQRLHICECHSSASWFKESPWRTRRMDAEMVGDFIRENPPYAQDCHYYICGPGAFLPELKAALNHLDVPNSRIHMESFGNRLDVTQQQSVEATLEVSLNGTRHRVAVAANESLLQAMLRQNVNPPYSCEGGVCGTCRCKLTQGKVTMQSNFVLDEAELKSGAVLACQSVAATESLKITY